MPTHKVIHKVVLGVCFLTLVFSSQVRAGQVENTPQGENPPPIVSHTIDDMNYEDYKSSISAPSLPFLGSITLMEQGFEGLFPGSGSGWIAFDDNGDVDGETYWDDDDYKPRTGTHSAWCADGGLDGRDPASGVYPGNAMSWMEYGPFDLRGYSAAVMEFYLWLDSEACCDKIFWGTSTNGMNYHGFSRKGQTNGWEQITMDLTNVPTQGNLIGQSKVWIGFVFLSDGMNSAKGAFIDDVKVEAYFPQHVVHLPTVFQQVDNKTPAPVQPNDYNPDSQWQLARVRAPEAWGYARYSTANIALVDSGVNMLDLELENKVWENWDEAQGFTGKDDDDNADYGILYVDDLNGWNYIDGSGTMYDDNGHGTSMAKIAAAETNNGEGGASLGWNASVIPLKAGDQQNVKTQYLDDAVRYARKNGAHIINMSLGTVSAPCPAELQDEINDAYSEGVLVVAAGNGDTFPANCEHVMGVSATDKNDQVTDPAAGSNYIDAAAPAGSTSAAAAMVSGLAALIKSHYPHYSADQLVGAVLCNADDIGDQNNRTGYGRINAFKSIRYGDSNCAVPPEW